MPRTSRPNRLALVALASVTGAGALLAACGDDDGDGGATAAFCDAVAANQDALFNAPLATEEDVAAFVALYHEVGEQAPLAIEDDWDAMTALFETAGDYEPDTTEVTEQDVLTDVFSRQQSALAVGDWLSENCQITIVVGTVAPPVINVTGTQPPSTA